MSDNQEISSGSLHPDQPAETEPLLGNIGSVRQQDGTSFLHNLFLGTGVIAQIGLAGLAIIIWISLSSLPFSIFSLHPLFNSVSIILLFESILLLQPTYTPEQKVRGAVIHSVLIGASILCFITAFAAIILNKLRIRHGHFDSPHAILGLLTYICIIAQTTIGIAQFYTPCVFGSLERAKSVYKYHRIAGYFITLLVIATVITASRTGFALGPLNFKTWKVLLASVLILLGMFPRIRKEKLGLKRH